MRLGYFFIFILMLVACQSKQPVSSEAAGGGKQPLPAHKAMEEPQRAAEANSLKGKVIERLDAGRYSYLRLSTPSGETWAAVLKTAVNPGSEVTILNPMPMDGFETQTLNRKFDRIFFGTLDQGAQQSGEMQALYSAHAGLSNSIAPGPIKVEKASGPEGQTIAEIFAQKAKLRDRTVAVRGKVVKVNAGIMNKTWIHLRDGSGNRESNTDDLTVTTQDNATVGDTVLVRGTVRVDKNLGMGYVFPVIVEDATVTKE